MNEHGRPPTLGQRVIAIAASYLGVTEATGHNDGPPSELFMGGRQEPWCAHYIAFCYRKAGAPLPGDVVPTKTRDNPIASVQHLDEMLAARGWRSALPTPGSIALFRTRDGSDAGHGRHCGLVEKIDGEWIFCIEANVSDGVHRRRYPFAKLIGMVSGFGHPPGLDTP
jgi:hypothetical protein